MKKIQKTAEGPVFIWPWAWIQPVNVTPARVNALAEGAGTEPVTMLSMLVNEMLEIGRPGHEWLSWHILTYGVNFHDADSEETSFWRTLEEIKRHSPELYEQQVGLWIRRWTQLMKLGTERMVGEIVGVGRPFGEPVYTAPQELIIEIATILIEQMKTLDTARIETRFARRLAIAWHAGTAYGPALRHLIGPEFLRSSMKTHLRGQRALDMRALRPVLWRLWAGVARIWSNAHLRREATILRNALRRNMGRRAMLVSSNDAVYKPIYAQLCVLHGITTHREKLPVQQK